MRIERRQFVLAACGLLGLSAFAVGQDRRRTARIGWLGIRSDSGASGSSIPLEGLRAGLGRHGWVEGENLVIEQRNGSFDNAYELATQLVQAKVALIVAEGGMIFRILQVTDVPLLFHVN